MTALTPSIRVEQIGNATLYCGDCRDVLPALSGVAAVVSDPPYGMAWNAKVTKGRNSTSAQRRTKHYGATIIGDDGPFDPAHLLEYERVVLWGSNHFSRHLPVGTTLIWIKRLDAGFGSFLSDAEVAWMKGGHGVYYRRDLTLQAEAAVGCREHPNQKPVGIMSWCIQRAQTPAGGIVLDPYMGSGSTGIAAIQAGHPFIGVEMDQVYFKTACRRIADAQRQPDLFVGPTPDLDAAYQRTLFGDAVSE